MSRMVHVFTAARLLLAAVIISSSTTAAFVGRTANMWPHRHAAVAVQSQQQHDQRGGVGFLAAMALTSSSTAAAVSKTNSEAAMDELSKAWSSLNQDTDAIQYPNIKKKAGSSAAPQQPPTTPDYGRLAKEWAVINKDTDTMKPTPPIVALAAALAPAAAQPALPPRAAVANNVDLNVLSKEWAARNKDVDNVQKTTTTAPRLAPSTIPSFSAAPLVPSMSLSITSETAHSMVQAAKGKWEELAAELAEINREAEQTFAALNEMEEEMNDMIRKMQLRESDHQERFAALQQSSAQRQDELLQKIEYITKEYEMFKRDALLAQQANAQQAAACQSQLQNQISQLQHDLQSKVQLLQQESSKAQYYKNNLEQTEQELKKTKQNFEQERLAMNQEQIESTQERIQMLRSVNANLRHMSSGSRAIMERMRIKLQCLDGI